MQPLMLLGAADLELIFKVLIFLVIAGFSVAMNLHKWITKKQEEDQAAKPPAEQRRRNPTLSDEIESFLRSAQKRQQDTSAGRPRRQSGPRRRPSRPSEPVMAEVIEAQVAAAPGSMPTLVSTINPLNTGGDGQRDSVARGADRMGQQARTLGAQIDLTDERVADEIHAKFDHQLGQFSGQESSSDDATSAAGGDETAGNWAVDLRRMLADPQDVRRAIVVSEILNPPRERW